MPEKEHEPNREYDANTERALKQFPKEEQIKDFWAKDRERSPVDFDPTGRSSGADHELRETFTLLREALKYKLKREEEDRMQEANSPTGKKPKDWSYDATRGVCQEMVDHNSRYVNGAMKDMVLAGCDLQAAKDMMVQLGSDRPGEADDDKMYHFLGFCLTGKRDLGGTVAAAGLSIYREITDKRKKLGEISSAIKKNDYRGAGVLLKDSIVDTANDLRANYKGYRTGRESGTRCHSSSMDFYKEYRKEGRLK